MPGQYEKAFYWLLGRINELCGTGGLAPIAVMAKECKVSLATMQKAVRRLCDCALLRAVPGKGIFLTGVIGQDILPYALPGATSKGQRAEKWCRIAGMLHGDILKGVFPGGAPLPPALALGQRYGANYKTVVKALRGLVSQNVIEEGTRGFSVAGNWSSEGSGCVVLVARGLPSGELFALSARTISNVRVLENECARKNLRLLQATVNDSGTAILCAGSRTLSLDQVVNRYPVIGFIVWTMGLSAYDPGAILRGLYTYRLPVAVFDEGDSVVPPVPQNQSVKLKHFLLGTSRSAGRAVARYLRALGHTHLAYISSTHDTPYSQARLEGICSEFCPQGSSSRLSVFACEGVTSRRGGVAWEKFKDDVAEVVYRHDIMKPQEFGTDVALMGLSRALAGVWDSGARRRIAGSLFEQAYHTAGITAWVVSTDLCALDAIAYLRAQRVHIPGEISVVGFDNSTEATLGGLTSYNFNTAAYMQAMIQHVFNPATLPWNPLRDPPIEIEGYINARMSTGFAALETV